MRCGIMGIEAFGVFNKKKNASDATFGSYDGLQHGWHLLMSLGVMRMSSKILVGRNDDTLTCCSV